VVDSHDLGPYEIRCLGCSIANIFEKKPEVGRQFKCNHCGNHIVVTKIYEQDGQTFLGVAELDG
jgi:DNA-directed RNA polymerase subunit RPC12/RpoP